MSSRKAGEEEEKQDEPGLSDLISYGVLLADEEGLLDTVLRAGEVVLVDWRGSRISVVVEAKEERFQLQRGRELQNPSREESRKRGRGGRTLVEPLRLILVTVDSVGNLLRRVTEEVVGLTCCRNKAGGEEEVRTKGRREGEGMGRRKKMQNKRSVCLGECRIFRRRYIPEELVRTLHRSDTALQEHRPVQQLGLQVLVVREPEQALLVVNPREVQIDARALPDGERSLVLAVVEEGGNAAVWVDGFKPVFLLLILGEGNGDDGVRVELAGGLELLGEVEDLVAVGGLSCLHENRGGRTREGDGGGRGRAETEREVEDAEGGEKGGRGRRGGVKEREEEGGRRKS